MASLPRIITVDPTARIPHQVRNAVDLMEREIIQIDVPNGSDALEEIQRGGCHALFTAWDIGDDMVGWELAAKVKQRAPETPVIVLADYEDTALDAETQAASPYVYLQRPFEPIGFMRLLKAALNGDDIFEALHEKNTSPNGVASFGPVPDLNLDRASGIAQQLLTDLNAMAVLLANRQGETLLERGALGFLQREDLSQTLVPAAVANLQMREMIGGNASSLQFYDGDEYDVYMLTVGLHYFMILIFDGKNGSRVLGNVRVFGRRAAEDLIALMGATAWMMQRPVAEETAAPEPTHPKMRARVRKPEPEDNLVELERASFAPEPEQSEEATQDAPSMDAIEAAPDELAALFDGSGGNLDMDLFDNLDKLEELARDQAANRNGTITQEEAERLGLIKR